MRQTICQSSFRKYSPSLSPTSHSYPHDLTPLKSTTPPPLIKKSPKYSPGVFCYYSESDEEDEEKKEEEDHFEEEKINTSRSETGFMNKRSRLEEKEQSNFPTIPYFPSSVSDIVDIVGTSLHNETNIDYNALDFHILDISQQISSIQLHKDSESTLLLDLQSKICQQEIEFLSNMESFTSMRKRKMKNDHLSEMENISEIENQIQNSLADDEKVKYLQQLDKMINEKNSGAINYQELIALLSRFDMKRKEERSRYKLTSIEEKKLKDYENYAKRCRNILQTLDEFNKQLHEFLNKKEVTIPDQIHSTLQELKANYLHEPVVERLRKGNDKIVLLSDSLFHRTITLLEKQKLATSSPLNQQTKQTTASPTTATKTATKTTTTPTIASSRTSMTSSTNMIPSEGIDILLADGHNDSSLLDEKKAMNVWIRNMIEEYNQHAPQFTSSSPISTPLQESLKRLAELFQLPDEKRTTARLTTEISFIEQTLQSSSTLPSISPTLSSLQSCLLAIFYYLLEYVIRSDSEEKILFYGHLSGAICRACGKIGGKILYSYLCACSFQSTDVSSSNEMNIEDPQVNSPLHIPIVFNSQHRKRLILFYATQMGSVLAPSRVDINAGWSWLVRCGILISRSIHNNEKQSLIELCSCLRGYLRIIGTDLQLTYGGKFISLMKVISSTLSSYKIVDQPSSSSSPEFSDLESLLTEFHNSGVLPCVLFKQKDSYSIYASSVIRSLLKLKKDSDELDADRSEEKIKLKKYLEVATLASAFNILGPDPDSHQRSIDMLTQHIARASSHENGSYLSYVLYKISKECLDFCQTPQWSVENSQPLAHVICTLCTTFPNLSELYRMQFYKLCPMTIPLLSVEGDGDAMMLNLGFIGKKGKDGKIAWEQPNKWLVRMNKIIGTFASVIIHPSSNPLNLNDGWLWLSKVVNYCLRVPTEPAPHTAKLLDTFLRILSAHISTTKKTATSYHSHFFAVIEIISENVLPKLTENNSFVQAQSHKQQLEDFISTYLESKGETCLPVLAEM